MRFGSIRARGLGPFREEVSIDFDAISGTLVAITGGNGEGKSTILELLAGAMYRTCPTRGPLAGLATARDAFLEVDVINGASHHLRHVVDSVSGKGESVVTDDQGRPLVASGKMREFDAWAAKHLPSPEVLYTSTFAAQGSGGFLDLKPGDRKAVLLRVLGIERLEVLAEKARERARSAKAGLGVIAARIGDEKARASDPIAIAGEIDGLHAKRADLEVSIAKARAELEELTAAEERAKSTEREAEALRRRSDDLARRLAAALATSNDVRKRLTNNEGVVAQAREIRFAQETAKELDAEIQRLVAALGERRAKAVGLSQEAASARDRQRDVGSRIQRASEREKRATARLADKATVDVAAATLPDLRAAVAGLEAESERAEESLRALSDLTLHGAEGRIGALRTAHESIATGALLPETIASEAIVADDHAAIDAGEAPRKLDAKRREIESLRTQVTTKRRELTAAERTAARSTEIAAAEAELVEVRAELARLQAETTAIAADVEAKEAAATAAAEQVRDVEAEHATVTLARASHEPLLKLVDPLTQAEARIAELNPRLEAARKEVTAIEAEIAALPKPPESVPLPDVAGARRNVDALDRELRSTDAAIAVKDAQLSDARASEGRLRLLESEQKCLDVELADWTKLGEDLGRDGLQALEIDAAGPELTELVNDLLRSCVGSRWTVTIEASRVSSDGKKTLEGCEVRVLDTERGRDGTAESLSGGERVLVGEAVSLALSMLACRRSGVQGPTLVRDESGAALDPTNARAYVGMLRRAAAITGASHVLFVSHSPEVQELADARIEIRDGKVQVAA